MITELQIDYNDGNSEKRNNSITIVDGGIR